MDEFILPTYLQSKYPIKVSSDQKCEYLLYILGMKYYLVI